MTVGDYKARNIPKRLYARVRHHLLTRADAATTSRRATEYVKNQPPGNSTSAGATVMRTGGRVPRGRTATEASSVILSASTSAYRVRRVVVAAVIVSPRTRTRSNNNVRDGRRMMLTTGWAVSAWLLLQVLLWPSRVDVAAADETDGVRVYKVGVLMTTKLESPFDLERCGPAVDLALDMVNNKYLAPHRIRLKKVEHRFVHIIILLLWYYFVCYTTTWMVSCMDYTAKLGFFTELGKGKMSV